MQIHWPSIGLVWLRIFAGVGMASHGYTILFEGRMGSFIESVARLGFPRPELFAWAAALSEFAGGLCLAIGIGTRLAAFLICCTMSVALFLQHRDDPFRAKELAYLYWAISGSLTLLGGGRYSLGAIFTRQRTLTS